jgi:PPOX class probable F420-dependent enzyme
MHTQAASFAQLNKASYISLTTFRKTGEAVPTPVWFAEREGTLYLFTFPGAGKVKRINHTARVTVAPCTLNGRVTGPAIEGKARVLTEPADEALAEQTLAKKYGIIWRLYHGVMGLGRVISRKPKSKSVWLAIDPAE